MSATSELIAKLSAKDPEFAAESQQASINLDASVLVEQLREDMKLSQSEFAERIGKSTSELINIEEGETDISEKTLVDVATVANKALVFDFDPMDID
ncbi:helix-turn-helix transcriptional regulator [uncultured Lactobacillus sp.]|uniref:helix-turn-helix domain-containing protein n=1 Tax=uncultured Lactobacillus sp. TaxID=153152 RepID=UPI0025E7C242|nr:helix-turn-helix domain-containing protein [uncultured Lactobacillus sp.]